MSTVEDALKVFAAGELIIVTDDESRENEGDFILLGEKATPEKLAFMIRYSSGVICASLDQATARNLALPFMVRRNQDERRTAYTISVDAKAGLTTGISATERANTIRALASQNSVAADFVRPGHIFPLVAVKDGLTKRKGHTEAGVVLAQLVKATPVSAISEVVSEDGSRMLRGEELARFAAEHGIPLISIEAIERYLAKINFKFENAELKFDYQWAQLPRETGLWQIAIHSSSNGAEHAILKYGEPNLNDEVLIRIHSECLTGDALGSLRCDCGPQLAQAFVEIEMAGSGYIIYLHDHEGRGIGLNEKIKAYQLQDQGLDTVEANLQLGHRDDERSWEDVIEILNALNLRKVQLLTNNPEKISVLEAAQIKVTPVNLEIQPNPFNQKYLETKKEKMSHNLNSVIKKG